jgi:hypothetical protein
MFPKFYKVAAEVIAGSQYRLENTSVVIQEFWAMLADLGVSAVSGSWGTGFMYNRSEVNIVEGGLFAP